MSEPDEGVCREEVPDHSRTLQLGGPLLNYVAIKSDLVRAALDGEPEAGTPFAGQALLTIVKRLKSENAALKAENAALRGENAEQAGQFGDRVQDSEVAARAVAVERERLIAAVREIALAEQTTAARSLQDSAKLILAVLENLL